MPWHDLGPVEEFQKVPLTEARVGRALIAVSWRDGKFGAVSGVCNHAGGPLGQGRLDGDLIQCPWHGWKFHRVTGVGEPGFEEDVVPRHDVKVEGGHLFVSEEAVSRRQKAPHPPHPVARTPERVEGPIRVVGISTTNMDPGNPATRRPRRCSRSRSNTRNRPLDARRGCSGSATSSFGPARVTTRSTRTPAPGLAPSPRWTTPTR